MNARLPELDELEKYVLTEPYPFVVDLARCEGMWLGTTDGRRLFDWAGYYGSKLIGHNHPRLYEPAYVERLVRAANNKVANPDFLTLECLAYYRALHALAPECMRNPELEVYVVNSGAEAVENLMKYFINLHRERQLAQGRAPATHRFIYFDQAFHGRTVFALNVTQLSNAPVVTRDFQGFAPGNVQALFPAFDAALSEEQNRARVAQSLAQVEQVLRQHAGEVVGIVVEPIQGAGGHRTALPEFFRGLSRLAHEHQVSLGFDEVQTAGGVTGRFFAADTFDLPYPPQAIAAGKKLANGVVYMRSPMKDRGVLDSTWGGTLSDMVRFVQEMEVVRDERLMEQVPRKAELLVDALRGLEQRFPHLVTNVRGLGLYQGFSLRNPAMKERLVEDALAHEDLLLLGAGTDTVRLRPNLHVSEADIRLLTEKLSVGLQRLSATVQ